MQASQSTRRGHGADEVFDEVALVVQGRARGQCACDIDRDLAVAAVELAAMLLDEHEDVVDIDLNTGYTLKTKLTYERLFYHGAFDEARPNRRIPVSGRFLREALEALLTGSPPPPDQKPSVGCPITWQAENGIAGS